MVVIKVIIIVLIILLFIGTPIVWVHFWLKYMKKFVDTLNKKKSDLARLIVSKEIIWFVTSLLLPFLIFLLVLLYGYLF
ncbi:hypothetical protein DXU93_14875 [Brumimicrobium aurantiacum]|uniref:Uncharacterized protein n=1 Tax=Brumimicrobium aurantiacum TaxID=1737063 RepID=A0A3E1EU56_9FLAO|nr:hypothetical protein DXU93_14875 [Brumimicrobium aurantiacum]